MDANQLAEKLGTTGKKLRNFIRKSGVVTTVGSGGKYDFDKSDVVRVTKRWNEHTSGKSAASPRPAAPVNATGGPIPSHVSTGDDTIPLRVALSNNPNTRREVRRLARARDERLQAQLRATNSHITQSGVARKSRIAS